MLDFIKDFADCCHHAKEGKQLFVRMEEQGLPVQGGSIGVMLQEHDMSAFCEQTSTKRTMFSIYPLANRVLTAADQTDPTAAFDRIEAEERGEGTHERYQQLVHEWVG